MAQPQMMQIKLSRFDAQPWGFRLQGGVDFAAPLLVQKVNSGSLAENAGLLPGDAVLKINDVDVFSLRHKDAQDIVVRSGNNFVITIQRGGSTWRPQVTPTGHLPQPASSPYLQTVTKTSLAHKPQEVQHIGSGYNNAARPFANGGDGNVKSIVNKQYNTPVGIYSDESIAETLSAQAEVLAGGVLGVNFKKNEKEYQAEKSEVLKFLREEETGGGDHTPAFNNQQQYQEQQHQQQHHQQQQQYQQQQQQQYQQPQQQQQQYQQPQQQQQQQYQPPQHQHQHQQSATKHVNAPINTPKPPSTGGLPTGQNICTECERLITGVFVRIKDKNLHVECFKCATCGTSLKNQGYYNFNNKLYCDIHAKLAAMQNPPSGTEGYDPVPIKPNTKLSANTISSALSAHGFNGMSNGSFAPAPAPCVEISDLPLPPPPTPSQLQQFQYETSNTITNNNNVGNISPHQHTRTHSSLSNSSSNCSSMSPTPSTYTATASTQQQQLQHHSDNNNGGGIIEIAFTHSNNGSSYGGSNSNLTLDRFASPAHSRQTSSSSSSLSGVCSAAGTDMLLYPPPPPPPMPVEAETTLYINTKNHRNNSNTKMLQQHVANENDMNMQNQKYASLVGPSAAGATTAPTATTTNNNYNKFLKEYSNKLLTQNNNNNHNTNTNTNTLGNKLHNINNNNNAKPSSTNVAAVTATLANQLKFNPCQVVSPTVAHAESNTNAAILSNNSSNNNNNITSNINNMYADEQSLYANTAPSAASQDQPFEYVTLTGNVIRSVVPPGKGVSTSYKVNQGYARPFGAAAPPAAAPKSPVTYPPQQQPQWGQPQQQQQQMSKPAVNPYATLPRSNVGQQGRHVQVYSNYNNIYNNQPQHTKFSAPQYRKPTTGPNKYATISAYNKKPSYNNYNNNNYMNNYNQEPALTNNNAFNATLPRKPHVVGNANRGFPTPNNNYNNNGASQTQPTPDIPTNNQATAMLTESIGKIEMGDKMNNFMSEAGKIISNMLEARLANNGALSHSGSTLSLRSNSSSNLSKSPMVIRKRFELDDFKDLDPTEPANLKPVVAMQQQVTLTPKATPPMTNVMSMNKEMPQHHPMGKLLDICDNRSQVVAAASKPTGGRLEAAPPAPPLPAVAPPSSTLKYAQDSVMPEVQGAPMETVVFRNQKNGANNRRPSRGGELSTHAIDRRSYIEPVAQQQQQLQPAENTTNDGAVFSVCVKALGRPETQEENAPMNAENEEVVSQLLKDGKRPICCQCNVEITKGPFITALGRIWCPDHFICVNANCRRPLQDIGFVEEKGDLYCEYCFEKYLAPTCSNCAGKIKGDCLNAIGKHFHPECFTCGHCGKLFGNTPFFLEEGKAYCEADWNELFTTKCFACGFPVEAGDRWVEALNHNYHSQCFNCTFCKQNLEGQSFYNKGGRPFCKNHAR